MSNEVQSGNIFIRKMENLKAGETIDGHKHNFDHTTILFSGAVDLMATLPDGRKIERSFTAPDHLLIKADVMHKFTASEDGTWLWCVYAHRDPQGRVIQQDMGFHDAYR